MPVYYGGMNDEYILSHGGTKEDIASYAHDNGACPKPFAPWVYCNFCDKNKEYYMKFNNLYTAKKVDIYYKENQDLIAEHDGEILAVFKILPEDDVILKKLEEYNKTKSITIACEIADDLYKLYN